MQREVDPRRFAFALQVVHSETRRDQEHAFRENVLAVRQSRAAASGAAESY